MSIDPIVTEISKRIAIGKGIDLDSWADADEAAHIRNAGNFEQASTFGSKVCRRCRRGIFTRGMANIAVI